MTIAKRLALLVAVAIISLLAVSISGYTGMSKVNNGLHFVNAEALPSINILNELKDNFLRRRLRILGHVLTPDEAGMIAAEKDMDNIGAKIESGLKEYEKHVTDDKDKAMLEADKKAYANYMVIINKVQQLSRAGQKAAAAEHLKSHQADLAAVTKTILDHAKYNTDMAISEGKKAEDLYNKISIIVIIVSVAAIVITALMGLLIYNNVNGSLENLRSTITDIETNLDFTKRATVKHQDEVGVTISAVNRLIQRLQDSMRTLTEQSSQVSSAAGRLANAANEVSTSSSHQSAAAADMAATVEELTVSINHVADQAGEANHLSAESGALAQSGEEIIVKTVEDINGIATTVRSASEFVDNLDRDSQRINTVISVIKEVADQTNLLALNAAIEAARAGEQGRGFAVVADEVRKLAERTAKSTQEITETIASMQINARSTVEGIEAVETSVARGVERAGEASQAISQIGTSSRNAVERVAEISSAIREQGHASTNIAQQLEKIAQMSEENNAAADNTSATAIELDKLAQEMKKIIGQYRI